MSRRRRKKKTKQKKLDYTNISKEDLKVELIKMLRTINLPGPSQKQLDFVVKRIRKLGKKVVPELMSLLLIRKGNDRDRVILVLMELNFSEVETELRDILKREEIKPEIKKAAFCILFYQDKLYSDNEIAVIQPSINNLRGDIQSLKELEGDYGELIEQKITEIPLIDKFLLLYLALTEDFDVNILNLLANSDIPKLRLEVALKLRKLEKDISVKPLLKLREDKDSDVRNMAKRTINFLRTKGVEFVEKVKELPVHCCFITKDISKNGLGTVLIARKVRENYINYAFFLIDVWGMGLKDVFGERKCHKLKFDKEVLPRFKMNPYGEVIEEDIGAARKLILGGLEFACQNSFKVPREFLKWKDLVGNLTEEEKNLQGLFGKNGEIIIMASPEDIMNRIIMDDSEDKYYDERKSGKFDFSFEEVLGTLESRGMKFLTSLDNDIPDDLIDILSEHEELSFQEPGFEEKIDSEEEQKVEPRVEQKVEPRVEQKVAPKVEQKVAPKVEQKVEPRAEQKEEHNVEPGEERKVEQKIEPEKKYNDSPPRSVTTKHRDTKKIASRKKIADHDFDMAMENMYDDLEDLIFQELYHKAYIQLDKMLRKSLNTSWEEDVLIDFLSFAVEKYFLSQ